MSGSQNRRMLLGHKYKTSDIPVSYISPLSEQVRQQFDEEAIEKLATSLIEVGQISPILVHQVGPKEYKIVGGERRWRAANRAKLENLYCYVFKGLSPIDFFTLQVHENFHEPIPAKDEARAIKRQWDDAVALGFDFTPTEFARQIRMSATKVRNALHYAEDLDQRIQAAVEEGILPYKIAVSLASIKDHDEQFRLANDILVAKDGFRQADEIIRRFKQAKSSSEQPMFEMTLEEWEDNKKHFVSAGIRWAAKLGLAYLERVRYLLDNDWLTKKAVSRSDGALIRGWVRIGQYLIGQIEEGEDA